MLTVAVYPADGDVFTIQTVEGRTMKMKVLSEKDKTCQVGAENDMNDNCLGWVWTDDTPFTVTIPATANGYTVTRIDNLAFYGISVLKGVTIPNTVTYIGEGAFSNCGLLSVELPNSVTAVGEGAFGVNQEMTSFKFSDAMTSTGKSVLACCSMLTSVTLPATLKTIDDEAFALTNLISVVIPDGVTRIGKEAFTWCQKLTSVTIPASVVKIGDNAFEFTNLSDVPRMDGMTSLPGGIFFLCGNMKDITIPANITKIYGGAFSHTGVERVHIAGPVTLLDNNAFYNCNSLKTINLPESLKTIGQGVFWNTAIEYIQLPSQLKYIGDGAFENCHQLRAIEIPNSVTELGWNVFQGCDRLSSAKLSENVNHLWISLFEGCVSLKSIVLPECVDQIESRAFYETGLTSIHIPKKVYYLPSDVFFRAPLERITVAEENPYFDARGDCNAIITSTYNDIIGQEANILVTGCMNTVIPPSVTTIGPNAFSGCLGLTAVNIPEGVKSIDGNAFNGCYNLETVALPSTLTNIELGAFQCFEPDIPKLNEVTALMTEPCAIGDFSFSNYEDITLYVPAGCKTAYENTDIWNRFKEVIPLDMLLPGDANGDSMVDVADVVAIVNKILDKTDKHFHRKTADVNGDGIIDVSDVVGVVNIILKGDN